LKTLRILSGGAAEGLVKRVMPAFRQECGFDIVGSFGAVGDMAARAKSGEAVDVLILSESLIAELAKTGLVDPKSLRPIGAVPTSVAIRSGDKPPAISTGDSLRSTLLSAPALFTPNIETATAGRRVSWMLDRMGIRDQLQPKLKIYPNGTTAMAAMASSGIVGAIGCTQATEILSTSGIERIGDLPEDYALSTVYVGAITPSSVNTEAAARLLSMLATSTERPSLGFI